MIITYYNWIEQKIFLFLDGNYTAVVRVKPDASREIDTAAREGEKCVTETDVLTDTKSDGIPVHSPDRNLIDFAPEVEFDFRMKETWLFEIAKKTVLR